MMTMKTPDLSLLGQALQKSTPNPNAAEASPSNRAVTSFEANVIASRPARDGQGYDLQLQSGRQSLQVSSDKPLPVGTQVTLTTQAPSETTAAASKEVLQVTNIRLPTSQPNANTGAGSSPGVVTNPLNQALLSAAEQLRQSATLYSRTPAGKVAPTGANGQGEAPFMRSQTASLPTAMKALLAARLSLGQVPTQPLNQTQRQPLLPLTPNAQNPLSGSAGNPSASLYTAPNKSAATPPQGQATATGAGTRSAGVSPSSSGASDNRAPNATQNKIDSTKTTEPNQTTRFIQGRLAMAAMPIGADAIRSSPMATLSAAQLASTLNALKTGGIASGMAGGMTPKMAQGIAGNAPTISGAASPSNVPRSPTSDLTGAQTAHKLQSGFNAADSGAANAAKGTIMRTFQSASPFSNQSALLAQTLEGLEGETHTSTRSGTLVSSISALMTVASKSEGPAANALNTLLSQFLNRLPSRSDLSSPAGVQRSIQQAPAKFERQLISQALESLSSPLSKSRSASDRTTQYSSSASATNEQSSTQPNNIQQNNIQPNSTSTTVKPGLAALFQSLWRPGDSSSLSTTPFSTTSAPGNGSTPPTATGTASLTTSLPDAISNNPKALMLALSQVLGNSSTSTRLAPEALASFLDSTGVSVADISQGQLSSGLRQLLTNLLQSGLAGTEFEQARTLAAQDSPNLTVPLLWQENQLPREARMHLAKDDHASKTEQKASQSRWQITLHFDLDALGPLDIELDLIPPKVSATFWSDRTPTLHALNDALQPLRQRLTELGAEVSDLRARHGRKPTQSQPTIRHSLVDIHT